MGGTCNNSLWREELIPQLNIRYFNPVVEDWTPECQEEELRQRELCDYCLYGITPKMTGVYSIAEVVDDSNKRPDKTVLFIKESDDGDVFTKSQFKSMMAVAKLVSTNGGKAFFNMADVVNFLNSI